MKTVDEIDKNLVIDGFYVKNVAGGFLGSSYNYCGKKMLRLMGLPKEIIPFDIVDFIHSGETYWKDCDGNIAYISFKIKGDEITCFGSYLGRKKTVSFTHDLYNKRITQPIRNSSQNMAESCMLCIYEYMHKES